MEWRYATEERSISYLIEYSNCSVTVIATATGFDCLDFLLNHLLDCRDWTVLVCEAVDFAGHRSDLGWDHT